ncbi:MAG: hypothetical protein U0X76_10565 [Bacteroidia bacterium]
MARPKKKSALVDGMTELVETLRSMDSKINQLLKLKSALAPKRGRGRPARSKQKFGKDPTQIRKRTGPAT